MPEATPDISFATDSKDAACIEGTPNPEPMPPTNKISAATTNKLLVGNKKYVTSARAEQLNEM